MKLDPVKLPALQNGRPGGLRRPAHAGFSATAGGVRSRNSALSAKQSAAEAMSRAAVFGNDPPDKAVRTTADSANQRLI